MALRLPALAAQADTDIPTVRVMFLVMTEVPGDLPRVEEALNRLLLPRIGARIKLLPISQSSYSQHVNLKLSGREGADLMVAFFDFFSSIAAKGLLLPLDGLLDSFGSGIKPVLGADYLELGRVNGNTYGVSIGSSVNRFGLIARRDICEELGIRLEQITSLDKLDPVLRLLKEKKPRMAPLAPYLVGNSIIQVYNTSDPLGDGFGVLLENGTTLRVVDWYASAQYRRLLQKVRSWYLDGLIMPEATTNKEEFTALLKYDRVWGCIGPINPQTDSQHSILSGKSIGSMAFTPSYTNTTMAAVNQWVIPLNSRYPEKAMQFLNLLYTDPEVVNVLVYGIQGIHYIRRSDGRLEAVQNKDAAQSQYNFSGISWELVNQSLLELMADQPADLWRQIRDNNRNARKSLAFGFNYDPSAVRTEIAAVTEAVRRYQLPLECGVVDPAVQLPAFIAALKTAGMDLIMAEKQRQLDAWARLNHISDRE
jgi:putative aldouronate transport system substrate-binding protein